MKKFVFLFLLLGATALAQTSKSKNLKLKYTALPGWTATEYGDKAPWETGNGPFCRCAALHLTKQHADGTMHVLVYPSTQSGLDSTKRQAAGDLVFTDVEKFDRVRINGLPYERKRSHFKNKTTNAKSFDAFRFFVKAGDRFYIIFAWQENMQLLNSTNEKELLGMVNAIDVN